MNNDLISRSALLESIKQLAKDIARENGGVDHVTYAMKVAFDMAKEAPAVDAEVVRHGRWIHVETNTLRKTKYYCSECGHWLYIRNGGRNGLWAHYCPNCGAKMDAEVQDGTE